MHHFDTIYLRDLDGMGGQKSREAHLEVCLHEGIVGLAVGAVLAGVLRGQQHGTGGVAHALARGRLVRRGGVVAVERLLEGSQHVAHRAPRHEQRDADHLLRNTVEFVS